ncbi:hypothetical protein ACIPX0_51160 [Streptomyces sp. NPDC090075]|uniref:hypothetical protein n=1 Tax=unclassified Streptomyces TaxID=2593676 RepID=UPI003827D44A
MIPVVTSKDPRPSWLAEEVLAHNGRIKAVVPAAEHSQGLPAEHHPMYDALLRQVSGGVHGTGLT